MAKKVNLAKQWQEVLGQAEVTDRQPSAAPTPLYLVQLRPAARKIPTPKRRLAVTVEREADMETPRPVKIHRHR